MLDEYRDIISIEELCEILIIGKNSAYKLLNEKKISAFRIGNRWKIPKTSLISYLSSHEKG